MYQYVHDIENTGAADGSLQTLEHTTDRPNARFCTGAVRVNGVITPNYISLSLAAQRRDGLSPGSEVY